MPSLNLVFYRNATLYRSQCGSLSTVDATQTQVSERFADILYIHARIQAPHSTNFAHRKASRADLHISH